MKYYKEGDIVIGTVTGVRPYAVFLNFENRVSGLLHISEISDSFIRDIDRFASVGDEIKVMVISVDPSNGFLRVSLKRVPEEDRFSTHSNSERKVMKISDEEFEPLKEKLDGWINATLIKAGKGKNND